MLLENVFVVIAFAAMTTFVSSHSVKAASFDCAGALTDTEAAICADDELSTLDTIMGYAWNDAFETIVSEEEKPVETSIQRDWLVVRNSCGSQISCIREAYHARLTEWPFMIGSINRVELYDFLTETFSSYFITNSGAFSASYEVGSLIGIMESSEDIAIEIVEFDFFVASEYFDIPKNYWTTAGSTEAITQAHSSCVQSTG